MSSLSFRRRGVRLDQRFMSGRAEPQLARPGAVEALAGGQTEHVGAERAIEPSLIGLGSSAARAEVPDSSASVNCSPQIIPQD